VVDEPIAVFSPTPVFATEVFLDLKAKTTHGKWKLTIYYVGMKKYHQFA
jgi:hypothetical protein